MNDFYLFWQISTDVETGKTKISRINGSIHTIPGKEVGFFVIDPDIKTDVFTYEER